MEERRNRIREAFFIDQLRLRESDRMTATEVNARTEEQMRLLGPMLARQQSELLRPVITRVLGIMTRRDMIAPAPEILEGQNFDIQYTSLIARTQKVNEGMSILRGLESMAGFFQIDPSAADNIDSDVATRKMGNIYGWSQDMFRLPEEVAQIRQSRAEAQAQAQQLEDAVKQADVVAKAGQA